MALLAQFISLGAQDKEPHQAGWGIIRHTRQISLSVLSSADKAALW